MSEYIARRRPRVAAVPTAAATAGTTRYAPTSFGFPISALLLMCPTASGGNLNGCQILYSCSMTNTAFTSAGISATSSAMRPSPRMTAYVPMNSAALETTVINESKLTARLTDVTVVIAVHSMAMSGIAIGARPNRAPLMRSGLCRLVSAKTNARMTAIAPPRNTNSFGRRNESSPCKSTIRGRTMEVAATAKNAIVEAASCVRATVASVTMGAADTAREVIRNSKFECARSSGVQRRHPGGNVAPPPSAA